MITRGKDLIKDGITVKTLMACISEHRQSCPRLTRLEAYYKGEHDILGRRSKGAFLPNNRIVCNFPKYATDTVCGYVFGNAIKFKANNDISIDALNDMLNAADAMTHDSELGKDLSVFGVGCEIIYMTGEETPRPKLALIDPKTAFVVYDDTVAAEPLFGVRYYPKAKENGALDHYAAEIYTDGMIYSYTMKTITDTPFLQSETPHYFGGVPLIEYWNNEEGMGDYEGVMSLVDAYNVLMSDRINDKERFVDAILLLVNAQLPEDRTDEDGRVIESTVQRMLENRILELPGDDADARYLVKTLNEDEIQRLADAITSDMHKFSMIPDFTDENFSGNSSGVALKYKLLSLENLAKVKERFFISGLRERLKIFANILEMKGLPKINPYEISIKMNRTLPSNELELAQIISTLKGAVSAETLLAMLPMVEDPAAEAEAVRAERREDREAMTGAFQAAGSGDNVRL
jgi:SPP1 family phage portal protein